MLIPYEGSRAFRVYIVWLKVLRYERTTEDLFSLTGLPRFLTRAFGVGSGDLVRGCFIEL